jgi:HemY protein
VRALHDPAWTADGYVSDRWRPVSPVSGKLDAFQWQTPVASLPSDKGSTIESSPFEDAMLAAPPPKRIEAESKAEGEPPRDDVVVPLAPAAQDNTPATAAPEGAPSPASSPAPSVEQAVPAAEAAPAPPKPELAPAQPAPLFRARQDIPKAIPQVIPIVRAPDDPGVDEDAPTDEFSEQIGTPKAQAGGWRGFLSRWGS